LKIKVDLIGGGKTGPKFHVKQVTYVLLSSSKLT